MEDSLGVLSSGIWYAKRWATLSHGRQESNILSPKMEPLQNLGPKTMQRKQADTPCQNGHNRARRASSKTHFPLNQRVVTPRRANNPKLLLLRARRSKASQRAGIMCLLNFLQGPNCESCNMTSTTLSRFQNLREMRRYGASQERLEKCSPRDWQF